MTQARSTIVKENTIGVYHCISRCVRRAFLCGWDPITKKNYEHRKDWLYQRLIKLADIFLIDVCGFAIMDNHMHLILRNRPDLTAKCSNEEIAKRWRRLFPQRNSAMDGQPDLIDLGLEILLEDSSRLTVLRKRLSSISWFMRCLKEDIAKKANIEDGCTGRFWEGRFKCVALLDQAAILTCSAYVDLNPIRAGVASTPESSQFTSARVRIEAFQSRQKAGTKKTAEHKKPIKVHCPGRMKKSRDSWLCPLNDEPDRKGFLNIDLDEYLNLLDWTGRQIVRGKRGVIPIHLAPILNRLKIDQEQWVFGSQKFGTIFFRVAGKVSNMRQMAKKMGQKWFKGKSAGQTMFLAA